MTLNDSQGRMMRWRVRLMEFEYNIVYHPDRIHQVPDALSSLKYTDHAAKHAEVDD